MGHDLRVQPFSSALLADVQGFDCGGDPWQVEVATWIKDTSTDECAVKWIERGTEVWLYRTADGSLVGYGALGQTEWSWPPPNGPKESVSIIPYFGVQKAYQGEPKDRQPEERYAYRIMGDLVSKAQAHGTRILGLFVDRRNVRAIGFYERVGFQRLLDSKPRPLMRMYLDLRE